MDHTFGFQLDDVSFSDMLAPTPPVAPETLSAEELLRQKYNYLDVGDELHDLRHERRKFSENLEANPEARAAYIEQLQTRSDNLPEELPGAAELNKQGIYIAQVQNLTINLCKGCMH